MMKKDAEVIIIGSGIAALMTAFRLIKHKHVMIITKSNVKCSNSVLAQGGIAAAISEDDHWQRHLEDTLLAGANHNDEQMTKLLVKNAPKMLKCLQALGVTFDRQKNGQLALGLEGAHGYRRIAHIKGDQTGRALIDALWEKLEGRVTLFENTLAYELLKNGEEIIGVKTSKGNYYAPYTVLATGGCGQLFEVTSNVLEATGDGIAIAFRAGATLADLEFVQFHPTVFIDETGKALGLISEAVRGEGARLLTNEGDPVLGYHPLKDLAPRDEVSRAVFFAYENGKQVFLDVSNIPHFEKRFPTISARCERYLPTWDGQIPIAPGAHFISGGIVTNENGRTTLPRLYAIGEVACTGVHGANRLASNSLLEGLVFAERLSFDLLTRNDLPAANSLTEQDVNLPNEVELPTRKVLQKKMSSLVGIVRSEKSLTEMERWLQPYLSLSRLSIHSKTQDEFERSNLVLIASLMTRSALLRRESRGGHYRSDIPQQVSEWRQKIVQWSFSRGAFMEQRNQIKPKEEVQK
ncbi:L-aspartate oxidase [Halalkalibacterium ligniniphilum]|uniref:L-aspartate oxidase n=1 Tax=Halalkalibacterium ligniniphilum TaxID=1134413 RepID=UPI000349C669|nr:L-aspartate oxidase [Halalkalibacterium ligniniphilum]